MLHKRLFLFISLSILISLPLQAKRFTSQYCAFELPSGWNCALEGAEWVCQSSNKSRQKEAIIILAAKIRGKQDSLEAYKAYLNKQKTFTIPGGKTQVSEPKYTKNTEVNKHQWVDSLHMASEVPGFYTRYLATVKSDLGVAVTFSVAKDHYNSYKGIFDNIIASMRVFRKKDVDVSGFKLKKSSGSLLGDGTTFIPDGSGNFDASQRKRKGGVGGKAAKGMMAGLFLLVIGGGVFMFMKKKKKKK